VLQLPDHLPEIVASFAAQPTADQLAIIGQPNRGRRNWAELRFDLYPTVDLNILKTLPFGKIPVIATLRSAAEGGQWRASESERLASFKRLIPHVAVIDIELSSEAILSEAVAAAHEAGKGVILSYHQFERMPKGSEMEAVFHRAKECGADLIKIAARAETLEEVRRMAQFTLAHAEAPIVTLAMGEVGAISRLCFAALGSRLSYAYVGEPTAPGQFSYREMSAWFDRLYLGRASQA
jgi:3-dehydroquinate dehydratase-1